VVLQVGWARGALASSLQPRGRQWRPEAGSSGQQSAASGLIEGVSYTKGAKASKKWLGQRRNLSRLTSMGTSRGAGLASTRAC
jgi:hypothetical protein